MTTGSCARPEPALQAQWPVRSANEARRSKTLPSAYVPIYARRLRRRFTDDSSGSSGAYSGGDVGGQECRERGSALLGLSNSFGRVGIGGRSATTVNEQGGAFVQQGPGRFAPGNEVSQRVEHLECKAGRAAGVRRADRQPGQLRCERAEHACHQAHRHADQSAKLLVGFVSVREETSQHLQNQLVGERGQLGHLAGAWFGNDRYRRRVVEWLARIRGEHGPGRLERGVTRS